MSKISKLKGFLLVLIDMALINIAYIFSMLVRFAFNEPVLGDIPTEQWNLYFKWMPLIVIIYIILLAFFKMYKSLWSFAGLDEVMKGVAACIIGCLTNIIVMIFINPRIPMMVTLSAGILTMVLTIGFRLSFRMYRRLVIYGTLRGVESQKNVLIVGAGSCGRLVINEMKRETGAGFKPIGVIDDDRSKLGTYINGVKVLGNRNNIKNIVKNKKIDLILIAIASITSDEKKKIIEACHETKVKVKIMPGIYEMIDGKVNLTKMRDVDLRDLLGREEVKLSKDEIANYLNNKIVLVTGGGGSIGSELCRQIASFKPKKLLILDIYENNAYDIQNELKRSMPELDQFTIIASVRDKKRLRKIFKEFKPDVVFHAAAHKHVPLMEENSEEAIKNNIVGTLNVAECADEFNAEKFVLISTDKAVNPTNIMGATKRMCEMIVQAMNKKSKTDYVAVRFGNVLGSNGSVIPLFKKQIKNGGPVTLTHKDIIRYFMLIPEAAQLVLQAGAFAKGGEIFILDMGEPVRIYDLAKKLIKLSGFEPEKDIKIEVTGLRPGEKLYEEILMSEEGLTKTQHDKIFIGVPSDFEINEIKKNIDELIFVALNKDKESLKKKMKEFVPTFKEPEEVNADKEVASTSV
ncbi:nucleoside-diphosphate sugar epimerase/dehydratase [Clostridium perfringens]|nr:nucleoside-diphosphate sugar epimerase/dehydratase [Clostridium perfringens]